MRSMRRYVSTLMIYVNSEIQTHETLHVKSLKAEHVCEVGSPVKLMVGFDMYVVLVLSSVNKSSDSRKTRNEVHAVFVDIIPIFFFADTPCVSFCKNTF